MLDAGCWILILFELSGWERPWPGPDSVLMGMPELLGTAVGKGGPIGPVNASWELSSHLQDDLESSWEQRSLRPE